MNCARRWLEVPALPKPHLPKSAVRYPAAFNNSGRMGSFGFKPTSGLTLPRTVQWPVCLPDRSAHRERAQTVEPA